MTRITRILRCSFFFFFRLSVERCCFCVDSTSHSSSISLFLSHFVFFFVRCWFDIPKKEGKKIQVHREEETNHVFFYVDFFWCYNNCWNSSDNRLFDRNFLFHGLGLKRACVFLFRWIPGECYLGIVFPFWKRVKTIYADRDKSPWDRSRKRTHGLFRFSQRERARERSGKTSVFIFSSSPLGSESHLCQ